MPNVQLRAAIASLLEQHGREAVVSELCEMLYETVGASAAGGIPPAKEE
jgi:hypothetical protein